MKHIDFKIIFVDVDETILYHHKNKHEYDKKSIDALKRAQNKGVKVVISTARPYDSLEKTGIFDLLTPDAVISCNGTAACVGNKLIYSDSFTEETVANIISVCNELNLVVEVSTPFERYFTMPINDYVKEYLKVFYDTLPPIRKDFKGEDVNAMLIYSPKELDDLMYSKLNKDITGYRFTPFGIDMHTHDVSKADGMNKVLEYFNIPKEQSLSIGDSFGDVAMFRNSGISVAMGNAKDIIKEKATFVTYKINHHGVRHALKFLKII